MRKFVRYSIIAFVSPFAAIAGLLIGVIVAGHASALASLAVFEWAWGDRPFLHYYAAACKRTDNPLFLARWINA